MSDLYEHILSAVNLADEGKELNLEDERLFEEAKNQNVTPSSDSENEDEEEDEDGDSVAERQLAAHREELALFEEKVQHQTFSSSSSSSSSTSQVRRDRRRYNPPELDIEDYDDGALMSRRDNTDNAQARRSKKQRRGDEHLDDIEEAMEMGVGDLVEEDEYESVPIIELNWERAVNREIKYEETVLKENKPNMAGLKPSAYDPEFNFLSFAVETKSQETSFPLFKNMFTFFSKSEETSDYVDLCMQVQDYYNEHIRPVSSVGNKCWPVKKIWEYFHITCPTIKHNLEFELRSMNKLHDTIANCVLKRNKTTGKTDQIDTKCIKLQFQIMEYRSKLMKDVFQMRFNNTSEDSKKQ